jgi:hypothetical protein
MDYFNKCKVRFRYSPARASRLNQAAALTVLEERQTLAQERRTQRQKQQLVPFVAG